MKKLISIAAAIILLTGLQLNAAPAAKEAKGAKNDNTQTFGDSRPRLFLRAGQEKDLMKKINGDPLWLNVHKKTIEECYIIDTMGLTEIKFDVNRKTMLSSAREILRKVSILSYGYRMTGNKSFATRAEKEMLHAAELEDWNDAKAYLDAAELTLGLAVGLDWLYDQLSPSSREKIAHAIIDKGIMPSFNKPTWWLTSHNNWNQVCNAALTVGAIAVKDTDPELMNKVIARAEESMPLAMSNYAPDGAYPEGPMYWEYGTQFNALYLDVYEKYFGKESELIKVPGFMKTGLYYSSMVTPTLNRFNYCDCSSTNVVPLSPAVMWFYSKTKDQALLFFQHKAITNPKGMFTKDRILIWSILWGAGSQAPMAKPVEPKDKMYVAQGVSAVATMRSSWTDPNALFVGVKAGSPNTGHGHMDVGSFIFEAMHVRWATDLGGDRYHPLETHLGAGTWKMTQDSPRWDIFRYSVRAHNTLMINDAKQLVTGKTIINEHVNTPELMSVVVDLTSIYSDQVSKAVRGVALVEGKYMMVEDVITTGDKPAKVRWNLTAKTTNVRINQDKSNIILFSSNKKRVDINIEAEGAVLGKWSAQPTDYDPTKTYEMPNNGHVLVGFDVEIPANTTRRLKVYLMPSADSGKIFTVDNPLKQIVK